MGRTCQTIAASDHLDSPFTPTCGCLSHGQRVDPLSGSASAALTASPDASRLLRVTAGHGRAAARIGGVQPVEAAARGAGRRARCRVIRVDQPQRHERSRWLPAADERAGHGRPGVLASGADWTSVRPGWFMQNVDEGDFVARGAARSLGDGRVVRRAAAA